MPYCTPNIEVQNSLWSFKDQAHCKGVVLTNPPAPPKLVLPIRFMGTQAQRTINVKCEMYDAELLVRLNKEDGSTIEFEVQATNPYDGAVWEKHTFSLDMTNLMGQGGNIELWLKTIMRSGFGMVQGELKNVIIYVSGLISHCSWKELLPVRYEFEES